MGLFWLVSFIYNSRFPWGDGRLWSQFCEEMQVSFHICRSLVTYLDLLFYKTWVSFAYRDCQLWSRVCWEDAGLFSHMKVFSHISRPLFPQTWVSFTYWYCHLWSCFVLRIFVLSADDVTVFFWGDCTAWCLWSHTHSPTLTFLCGMAFVFTSFSCE